MKQEEDVPLDASEIVYRLASNKSWLNAEGNFLPRAFLQRSPTKTKSREDGLSVFIKSRCNFILKEKYPSYYGVASLYVGSIRDIQEPEKGQNANLNVVPDDQIDPHALITGLCDPQIEPIRAAYLSDKLAEISRRTPWQ